MNAAYGSSRSFGYVVRLKYIVHNTYIGRRSKFSSKTAPINVQVSRSDLDYS